MFYLGNFHRSRFVVWFWIYPRNYEAAVSLYLSSKSKPRSRWTNSRQGQDCFARSLATSILIWEWCIEISKSTISGHELTNRMCHIQPYHIPTKPITPNHTLHLHLPPPNSTPYLHQFGTQNSPPSLQQTRDLFPGHFFPLEHAFSTGHCVHVEEAIPFLQVAGGLLQDAALVREKRMKRAAMSLIWLRKCIVGACRWGKSRQEGIMDEVVWGYFCWWRGPWVRELWNSFPREYWNDEGYQVYLKGEVERRMYTWKYLVRGWSLYGLIFGPGSRISGQVFEIR